MTRMVSLMALIALLTLGQAATAMQGACPLIAALSAQVHAATGYAPIATCPGLRRIGFGDAATAGYRSQAGEYVPETDTIYLAKDLDLRSAFGRSVLLHELVHVAQVRAGVGRARCRAALEYEAYAVQADYLTAAGLSAEAGTTRLLGLMLGICPGDQTAYD